MRKSVTVILHDGHVLFEKSHTYLKSFSIDIPRTYFEKPYFMNMFMIKHEIDKGLKQYFTGSEGLQPAKIERTAEKVTYHYGLGELIEINNLNKINNINLDVDIALMFTIARIGIADDTWTVRLNLEVHEDGEVFYQKYLRDKYGGI